jgi:uncharacterized protein YerC
MSELKDIKQKEVFITLNGKERRLKMGMSAMAKIEEAFGDIQEMVNLIQKKPGSTMPKVILCLMKTEGNEDITKENIAEFLDDAYTINELQGILDGLAGNAMPEGKKSRNPPKAETVK